MEPGSRAAPMRKLNKYKSDIMQKFKMYYLVLTLNILCLHVCYWEFHFFLNLNL